MRALFVILLAFTLVVENDAFLEAIFNLAGNILETFLGGVISIFGTFVNVFKTVVGVGLNVGGRFFGVVVDPFGLWKDNTNDHGHKDGKVVKCLAIADIIFVLDSSGSMSRAEFVQEINFARRLVEHFNVNEGEVKFAALSFSDRVELAFGFNNVRNNADVDLYLQIAPYIGGRTDTAGALNYILSAGLFTTQKGARDLSSKIVIVVTDGQSDFPTATAAAASLLKSRGIRVIAVGVGTLWGINSELYNIASGSNNVYTADFFSNLNSIEQKVALKTCNIPIEDGNVPRPPQGCKDGYRDNPKRPGACIDDNECLGKHECQQTCINIPGSYRCTCKSGYVIDTVNPYKCKAAKSCTAAVDIVVVIDASGSIGDDNFKSLLTFLAKVTLQFTFGPRGAQWAAVLFGSDVQPLFKLNTYSVRADISKALTSAPWLASQHTNTNKGLDYVINNNLFSEANGGRPGVPKVVLVVTDGQSSRPDLTLVSAKKLKQSGVKVNVVGITNQISTDELADIATDSKTGVFLISDWDLLDYAEENVAKVTCPQKIY